MKTIVLFPMYLTVAALIAGCQAMPQAVTPVEPRAALANAEEQHPLARSLFPADQAVLSDEAISKILSSKMEIPTQAKLALMKFPGTRRYYWSDEDTLSLQQEHVDTLSKALLKSEAIHDVTPLPSLMTPQNASIPLLREAAVRMQSELLLVFRVTTDTYFRYRSFSSDKTKAYSTCELVLLDVRTGLIPFTAVVTRDRFEARAREDLSLAETMRRAEKLAADEALRSAADDLVRFIQKVSRK
jgi:hypothetical protein